MISVTECARWLGMTKVAGTRLSSLDQLPHQLSLHHHDKPDDQSVKQFGTDQARHAHTETNEYDNWDQRQ